MFPIRNGGEDSWKKVREMREKLAEQKRAMDRRLPRSLREGRELEAPPKLGGKRPVAEPAAPANPAAAVPHGAAEEEAAPEVPHTRVTATNPRGRAPLSHLHGATVTQKFLHLAGHMMLEWLPAIVTGKSRHQGTSPGTHTPERTDHPAKPESGSVP